MSGEQASWMLGFVSLYLDDLLPMLFNHTDVSALLGRTDLVIGFMKRRSSKVASD